MSYDNKFMKLELNAHLFFHLAVWYPFNAGKQIKMFNAGEVIKEDVVLWTDTSLLTNKVHVVGVGYVLQFHITVIMLTFNMYVFKSMYFNIFTNIDICNDFIFHFLDSN